MSVDSHQFGESTIFSPQCKIACVNLFSSPQNEFLKDSKLMSEAMLFKDSESAELVCVGDEVSGVAEELDLGYDTNSELSSPMSAKSDWGDASTPSSAVGSCQEEDLFPDFDEETRNSLISILDEDASLNQWNQSLHFQSKTPANSHPTLDLSPRSPMVGQVPRDSAAPVDFSALHTLLQPGGRGLETSTPTQAAKPVRKRSAASLSTCGVTPRKRPRKCPSLIQNLPEKQNGAELQIVVQPEKHHRARYRTEGSRGSVKDDSGETFPKLKLIGVNQPVTLQVFVGTDQGKVRPHGYYQACKVTGRNTTPCEEKDVDGTTVLEVPWEPSDGQMEISVDCIGILKLRNADVEQRIGLIRSKRKSTCVRLVFRVFVPAPDGSCNTLQLVSRSVTCTQPLGHPEILKKSLTQCSVAGGEELFIIGKNFTSKANTEVKLRQLDDNGKMTWEGDCEIDKSLFQNNHIVCKIPPYPNQNLRTSVTVYLVVTGKPNQCSDLDAHPIDYIPLPGSVAMRTSPVARNKMQDANLGTVLPPTPTSPPASLTVSSPGSQIKLEPAPQLPQRPPTPDPNEDEFALALQMMASAYLKNKDMYNNLLMQTQTQVQESSFLFDGSSQDNVLDVISAELLASPDCAVSRVYQVQADEPAVVKTEAPAYSQALINTVSALTTVAPDLAGIYENITLPDKTDPHVFDDVLDVLNNN